VLIVDNQLRAPTTIFQILAGRSDEAPDLPTEMRNRIVRSSGDDPGISLGHDHTSATTAQGLLFLPQALGKRCVGRTKPINNV
jgi:hypothetical protein